MGKGRYYSVSVGPGDPENMTLKAVRLLNEIDVIAVPQTKSGQCMAMDIAKQVVDFSGKTLEYVHFTMSRDPEVLSASREAIADQLEPYMNQGKDVAMINIGDVSVYSTALYIAEILQRRGYETSMISGVTSFCASAAAANISLVEGDNRMTILSASDDMDQAMELPGTKVIMKSGKQIDSVIETAKKHGAQGCMVCNCGLENQKVYQDIHTYHPEDAAGYFAVIVVK